MRAAGALAISGAVTLPLAASAAYPDKPIRLVVPYPPGGATDLLARELAPRISTELGQQVVIENRPGASGNIGGAAVAKAAPDGYTLLLDGLNLATNPSLFASMPFDPQSDLTPITSLALSPLALVVNTETPGYGNVAELLADARKRPGELTYGSAGNGNPTHIFPEVLKRTAQLDIKQIPYRGSSPAMTDLAGGQVSMLFASVGSVQPFLQSGKLKALAVTGNHRSTLLPDVPTLVEAGVPLPETDLGTWWGLFGPAGLTPEVAAKVRAATHQVLASPEMVAKLQQQSYLADPTDGKALAQRMRDETAKWAVVIRESGVTPQ